MLYGYFKLILSLLILLVTLVYATQLRLERDMWAIKSDVQHPPDLKWVIDHPRELLERNRMESKYLRKLVQSLDD
jgi:hypothetical protein